MKRSNIKLMSLIIILIFCLSPLSAIDLNEDNTTAMDNDNNNTDVIVEDAKVNDSAKDIKVSEVKEDEEEKEPIDPELRVYVPDVNPAEETIAEISLNENYTGLVEVKLDGVKIQTVRIRNGIGHVLVGDELLPGEHSVEVISQATDDFLASETKTTFTVSTVPHIYPLLNDISDDEPLYVKIRTSCQYNGLVVCILEDGSTQYGFAKDGLFSCTFNQSECFTSGFHNLHIVIVGDDVFSKSEMDKSFHVG